MSITEKDVKEKIQNAQKRLKKEFDKYKDMEGTWRGDKIKEIINRIFVEEFGEKLICQK